MHHQKLYLSVNGYYYIVHSYDDRGGETKPSSAEMITHPAAMEWLRANGHEITPELKRRRVL
jgi:hypothetical protein